MRPGGAAASKRSPGRAWLRPIQRSLFTSQRMLPRMRANDHESCVLLRISPSGRPTSHTRPPGHGLDARPWTRRRKWNSFGMPASWQLTACEARKNPRSDMDHASEAARPFKDLSANGNKPLNSVSQSKGALQVSLLSRRALERLHKSWICLKNSASCRSAAGADRGSVKPG